MDQGIRNYLVVTGGYWAFTITDGAIRMLVVLFFHQLGYTPFEIASLFLFYEFFGIPFNVDSLAEAFHGHWPEIQGWNNDDPRLMRYGIPPSSEDYWVQTIQMTDTDTLLIDGVGPIYKYNPLAEEVAGIDHPVLGAGGSEGRLSDQIRELNQSIRLWNEALAKNELEKFVARRRLENGIGDDEVVMPFDLVTENPDFEEYNAWGMNGDNTQPMILAISGGIGLDFTAAQSESRRHGE